MERDRALLAKSGRKRGVRTLLVLSWLLLLSGPAFADADLSLSKAVMPMDPAIGGTVVFTLTVSNAGPDDAAGVEVTDPIPAGYTYVSDDGGGAYASGTGVWTVGTVSAGGSSTLNISATANATGDFVNVAEITASGIADPDSVPGNGALGEDDLATASIQFSDLSLSKTVDTPSPAVGATVVFTLTASNDGVLAASNVEVVDLLPSGFTYVSHTTGPGDLYVPATGVWSINSVPPAGSATLTITATVNATGVYLNQAEVTVNPRKDPDSTPNNGVTTEDDYAEVLASPGASADLSLTKVVDDPTPLVGAGVVFTLTVSNAGPDDATGVEVTDLLPAGYTYVSDTGGGSYNSGTGVWVVGTVGAGGSAALDISATVNASGPYQNVAEVTAVGEADPDSTPANGVTTEDDYAAVSTVPMGVPLADLSLTKVVDDPTPPVGAGVVFTLTVSNAGPDGATGVEVTDLLPAGFTYVSDTGGGSYNSGTGVWVVGTVGAGGSVALDISATVNSSGPYQNVAEVTSATEADPDSTPANGVATEDDYAMVASTPVIVTVPDTVRLVKTATKRQAIVGSSVGYRVEAENISAGALTGVFLRDRIPGGFKLVEDTARLARVGPDSMPGTSDDPISDIGVTGDRELLIGPIDMAAGEVVRVSYLLRVGSGTVAGDHTNRVTPFQSGVPVGGSSSATVEVVADQVFDTSTIIGKVFEDGDRDGWQDPDEPGVGGVMVALDEGTYAVTDEHGRYHFPRVRPGQRMVKINLLSVRGAASATDGESRILWVTPGLLAKANFGIVRESQTESVGAPAVGGIAVESEERRAPIDVRGSAGTLSLLVNGAQVDLPAGAVSMQVEALDHLIEIVGSDLERPAEFEFSVDRPDLVSEWTLAILTPEGAELRLIQGSGSVPEVVRWDGRTSGGKLVQAGGIYQYELRLRLRDGSTLTSARRTFGVNRRSLIALNLTGDAFQVDRADLSAGAKRVLREAAVILRQYPQEKVSIEGHTDSTGDAQYNLDLSRSRAEAARDYLTAELGLPSSQFIVKAMGETLPIAPNELAEGRALNRRIEIRGEMVEVEQAEILDHHRASPSVTINGQPLEVGPEGRFSALVDDDAEDLHVRMGDAEGRSVEAQIDIPGIEILAPRGRTILAYGSGDPSCRIHESPAVDGSLGSCDLRGRTDPGNTVELDGRPLVVDGDGGFRDELPIGKGHNPFGLMVTNAAGYVRIVNLEIDASDHDTDGQLVVIQDAIPDLTISLPPRGATLKSNELSLSGFTDPGNLVTANGLSIPVGADGTFSGTVELPSGPSVLVAEVTDPDGRRGRIEREVTVARHQLFLLAFAEGTIGQLKSKGHIEAAGLDDEDTYYSEGRIAYYLKGKIAGKYLITSAYDSGAKGFTSPFKSFDPDSADRLLTNLDPDRFYPVYGDDSTVVYDAESGGEFYLALDSETLHVLVGNYPLALTQTELATYQRTLYGGRAAYRSASATRYGEPDTQVVVFGADVSQIHARDEIVATGGSLYYLSHEDIVMGSEQVTLVVRDKNTGLILSRQVQRQNLDYDIKYPEGRLMFRRPLTSVSPDGSIVNEAILAGHQVLIQVDYETRVDSFDKTAAGGRVRQQVGDQVAVGASYVEDETLGGTYELKGVDSEIRFGSGTRFVAEYAESHGAEATTLDSRDGGLSFAPTVFPAMEERGEAWKAAADVDIGEWFDKPDRFRVNTYYKDLDADFSSSGNSREQGTRKMGFGSSLKLTGRDTVMARYNREERDESLLAGPGAVAESTVGSIQWNHTRPRWGIDGELFSRDEEDLDGGSLTESRLVAARFWSRVTDKLKASVSQQETLSGPVNDQTTLDIEHQVLPSLALALKATEGSRGHSAQAGAILRAGEGRLYLTERVVDDRAGEAHSTVIGAESPLGPSAVAYSEYQWESADAGDRAISLVGLRRTWEVEPGLKFTLSGERSVIDSTAVETNRSAVAGGVFYQGAGGLTARSRNEVRREEGTADRIQYFTANNLDLRLNPDFSLLGRLRLSSTRDTDRDRREARIQEGSMGLAYRPTRHDRFNALARVTRLLDQRPAEVPGQFADETLMDVISLEGVFDATARLEWSGKMAVRFMRERPEEDIEVETQTSLAIQRLNVRLWKQLGFGVEYRILAQKETDDRRSGWLSEVSWNLARNFRLGAGYNFTDFSDNEFSRNDYSVHGPFIRVQARY